MSLNIVAQRHTDAVSERERSAAWFPSQQHCHHLGTLFRRWQCL